MKAKANKDNKTITYLLAENKKMKEVNEQLVEKLSEKEKEILALRERLILLRK